MPNNPKQSGSNITGVSADNAQQNNAQALANAGTAASSAMGGATTSSSAGGTSATSSMGGTTAASSTGVGAGDARQRNAEALSKAGQQPMG